MEKTAIIKYVKVCVDVATKSKGSIGEWEVCFVRYYISDLHFYHSKLNDAMDCRGFESGEAMNEYMIEQWNSRVRHGDEVVILGDLCLTKSAAEANEIVSRLNGRKCLIIGNHDKYLERRGFDKSAFVWTEYYHELNDNKRKVILSHYPIMCYNGQYHHDAEGAATTYMLYGHVHNTFDEFLVDSYLKEMGRYRRTLRGYEGQVPIPCHMINCFCMFSDYVPLTLDEWIVVDRERREKISAGDYEFSLSEKDGETE